jgi:hypothetical protein
VTRFILRPSAEASAQQLCKHGLLTLRPVFLKPSADTFKYILVKCQYCHSFSLQRAAQGEFQSTSFRSFTQLSVAQTFAATSFFQGMDIPGVCHRIGTIGADC